MKLRSLSRLLLIVPFVLVAAHCKELPYETSLAPRNECSSHPCEAYRQDGVAVCDFASRLCKVNSTLDFTVLLSTPAGAAPYFVPLTAVMTSVDLANPQKPEASCPNEEGCVNVPALASALGWYSFEPAAQAKLGRPLGNPGFDTTIPHHTIWFPLAYDERANRPKPPETPLSTDFGIPALPVYAPMYVFSPLRPEPGISPPPGPFASDPIGWLDVPLPAGRYLRVIAPDPPFDQVFPPHESIINLTQRTLESVDVKRADLDPLTVSRTLTIFPDPDGPPRDLTGFTAVMQNSVRHRNISRIATLHAGTNNVTLFGHDLLTENLVELVIAPPPGLEGIPSLVSATQPVIPGSQAYPVVPPPATVTGNVQGPEGTPAVQASIVFKSVEEPGALKSNQNVLLRYATTITTDASGAFKVTLPLGRYDVAVLPEASSPDVAPLALWSGSVMVDGPEPKLFPLVRQTSVRGTVVLADGSAVPEAEVEAHAAVRPSTAGRFAQAMRTVRTITGAIGEFSLELDPGDYDIVVRPRAGTRFPWVVSTSHKIADLPVTLDRLVVPAPIVVSATLTTPSRVSGPDDPIVRGALVRAFAVPRCPSGQSCGGPAVEIGQALTDANGKLELFLTEPRSVSARPPN